MLSIVMLGVVIPSVVMLRFLMLSVVMLNVIILNIVMLSVIILIVDRLNDEAPFLIHYWSYIGKLDIRKKF